MEETRHAASDDEDRVARAEARETLSAENAGERFDEDRVVVRDRRRQAKDAKLHVDRGDSDEFRESTRVEVRGPQSIADGLMARQAISALAARHMMRHEHAVADLHLIHASADLGNFGGNFMTEDERRLRLAVPLHHVGAANPARANLDENLSWPDLRLRKVDDPHVVV